MCNNNCLKLVFTDAQMQLLVPKWPILLGIECWRADDGPNIEWWLGGFVIFAKIPYIFVIFQGEGGPARPPPLWTRQWNYLMYFILKNVVYLHLLTI